MTMGPLPALAQLVDALPTGLVIVDAGGAIVLANREVERMLGHARSELVGQPIEVLLPERYRGGHRGLRDGFARAPAARPMGSSRDLTAVRKDGTEIPVEVGLHPVEWQDETMFLAAMVDISLRKELERELRQANADLEEFTHVVSHDLKSPLRGIGDLLEWLRDDLATVDNPAVHRNLERVRLRIARMESIISDLLAYARAGRTATPLSTIVPGELVDDVLAVEPLPPAFLVSVDCTAAPFRAARAPLETVLRNVVANAVKHHHRPDGNIAIAVTEEGSFCHFAVCDDGPGMATPPAAPGIGLTIASRLVDGHGGRIVCEPNHPDPGVTFHVYWPRFPGKDCE